LWQRLAEESPHTSDDEIERLFIAATKDNEDLIRQITDPEAKRIGSQAPRCLTEQEPKNCAK
jgi:hypothetical protein